MVWYSTCEYWTRRSWWNWTLCNSTPTAVNSPPKSTSAILLVCQTPCGLSKPTTRHNTRVINEVPRKTTNKLHVSLTIFCEADPLPELDIRLTRDLWHNSHELTWPRCKWQSAKLNCHIMIFPDHLEPKLNWDWECVRNNKIGRITGLYRFSYVRCTNFWQWKIISDQKIMFC